MDRIEIVTTAFTVRAEGIVAIAAVAALLLVLALLYFRYGTRAK
jgi:hypothetical protein